MINHFYNKKKAILLLRENAPLRESTKLRENAPNIDFGIFQDFLKLTT